MGNVAAFPCAMLSGWGGDPIDGKWKGKNAASNGDDEEV